MIGVFIAGNAAFILGVMVFSLIFFWRKIIKLSFIKKVVSILLLLSLLLVFINYFSSEMERKSTDGNQIKAVQVEVFLDTNEFFGKGVAARVPEMSRIAYNPNSIYFEMQTFYIYYQIGLIGMLIFILLNTIALSRYKWDTAFLYLIYILYSAFNPGSFDTTHFIAILMCCNLE
jgi:hypothetical protein